MGHRKLAARSAARGPEARRLQRRAAILLVLASTLQLLGSAPPAHAKRHKAPIVFDEPSSAQLEDLPWLEHQMAPQEVRVGARVGLEGKGARSPELIRA